MKVSMLNRNILSQAKIHQLTLRDESQVSFLAPFVSRKKREKSPAGLYSRLGSFCTLQIITRLLSWGNDISYLRRFDVTTVKVTIAWRSRAASLPFQRAFYGKSSSPPPRRVRNSHTYICETVVAKCDDRLREINSIKPLEESLMKAFVN